MNLHIGHSGEAKRLPKAVREYMRHRFMLLPEYLDALRCFEHEGERQGAPVRVVKVFSPESARNAGVTLKTHLDLEKNPGMLLYEGHIDRQGKAYVADRRAVTSKPKKPNLGKI